MLYQKYIEIDQASDNYGFEFVNERLKYFSVTLQYMNN